ncbi:hypothetical protein EYF80_015171 [Liparis tanakae]|uniref:Uncharacterized protein n=1 Tax=Liparis tanakae TaxID=230148 RepID=A0A4Z2IBC2_9TELE|nr:hypothetical protein EYF80_015171 [Liparis tanakae]
MARKSTTMVRRMSPMKRHRNLLHNMNFMVLHGLVSHLLVLHRQSPASSPPFPVSKTSRHDTPHLLGNQAELFSRQVLKVKDEPPVEVAVSVQRPVVDVSLLLVVLHARHPADHREQQGDRGQTKYLRCDINLRDLGLEGAVKGPGLHVFGGQSLFSEHVQTEAFPGRTEVLVYGPDHIDPDQTLLRSTLRQLSELTGRRSNARLSDHRGVSIPIFVLAPVQLEGAAEISQTFELWDILHCPAFTTLRKRTELGKLGLFFMFLMTTDSTLCPPHSTTRLGEDTEASWKGSMFLRPHARI